MTLDNSERLTAETLTERLEREHKATIDALEAMFERMPAASLRAFVTLPGVLAKYRELEAERDSADD